MNKSAENNRVHGPIAKLLPQTVENYYPVLTISTNTDNNRNLTKDSFIVLCFYDDIQKYRNYATLSTLDTLQNKTLKSMFGYKTIDIYIDIIKKHEEKEEFEEMISNIF
jgi:hypothetical protein